jgi:Trk K+ transport system NAD-binding subunit
VEMVYQVSQDRSVYLVRTHGKSRIVGLSVAEVRSAENVKILAIYRMAGLLAKPADTDKIAAGDRLLAYGDAKTLKGLLSRDANDKAKE